MYKFIVTKFFLGTTQGIIIVEMMPNSLQLNFSFAIISVCFRLWLDKKSSSLIRLFLLGRICMAIHRNVTCSFSPNNEPHPFWGTWEQNLYYNSNQVIEEK